MNKNPIIPFLLIIFLGIGLVFLLSGEGATDDGEGEETASTEESGGGEEGGADSGDVDAEGIARDNCASCHGQDFSGGMGPALAGTGLGEDEFHDIVLNGQGSMPSFDGQLGDEEITALYEFFTN
ncbi:c-type cytochrome [Corticicoccus populi]|uniref:C-type cytochrome n=1 Tax=Corticicoccus populi TaxID=1812821 RepID=A0ABW5WRP6_9STAP